MSNEVKRKTQEWVENVVLGLNLCPFGHDIWQQGRWEITVSDKVDIKARLETIEEVLDKFLENKDQQDNTILLVFPEIKENFIRFYNFTAMFEETLRQKGIEDLIQIVAFHPQFKFEGEKSSARGNYVNRSPYPMIHFLWANEVKAVMDKKGNDIGQKVAGDNNKKLSAFSEEDFQNKVLKYVQSDWESDT